ncbi:MAG: sigma-54-dependent Fis family transcriptional regulator [Deltaproteobacteria bacterium]|nr:MAG: sigma-54-dependent Fis family transcriptional regulator [Deltaproteobacteria bacterium]
MPEFHERILVVNGVAPERQAVRQALQAPEREIFLASTLREALGVLHDLDPSMILVSLGLSDTAGPQAIEVFRDRSSCPVVATSSEASITQAVEAVRRGAIDYVRLPEEAGRLSEMLRRALHEVRTQRALRETQEQMRDRYGFSHMLTRSPRMLKVFDQVRQVASTDATVLVRGETGTGKELISSAIHQRSRRRDGPLIAVNCGAFTESLLESELFGHERGSFTGAVGKREGLFEMANSGTLFLDELGETSLNVQVNLLRVLEEMAFRRVGGREKIHVDVRIIAATNVELEKAVKNGDFREDLYYRLAVFPIMLPALRERSEDIPLLMRHFLDEIAQEYGLEPPSVSAEAMQAILAYRWPGNVRQLRAMCERWVITHAGRRIEQDHLPSMFTGSRADVRAEGGFVIEEQLPLKDNLNRAIEQVERAYLHRVLRRTGGHLERTADEAGISRRTLYTKMKLFGLQASDFKKQAD